MSENTMPEHALPDHALPEHHRPVNPSPAGDRPARRAAEPTDGYLKALGEKVRNLRARRGMTRKILARDTGISERYLAQLESGHGNISIILLRQVALAMNVPMGELVRDGPDRPVELSLLLEKLNRLDPTQLTAAAQLLGQHFGVGVDRKRRIALIGLRGGGKSTLGRLLAERLQVPFVELVKDIEAEAGMSLNEIFSLSGQAAYRRLERRALDRAIAGQPSAVIATGGSLVSEPGTFERMLENCYTIWVRTSPEEHMSRVIGQGDLRPMAGNQEAMADLRRILAQREALYAKADAVLDTSGRTIDTSLADLLALLPNVGRRAAARSAATKKA